ncbi:unnamed protein product [Protopolystoma xenopodis]|uniref:Uncharacterized protein n=1 Tax=Protopolystoma xenopodis TaxID=117903 RepID=A0A3S5A974_9PLAT|nr:unnamed protein product [Protopolystoma xenopodis]
MACVTLKRPHALDILQTSSKRGRFACSNSPNVVVPDSPFVPREPITQGSSFYFDLSLLHLLAEHPEFSFTAQLKRRIKDEIRRLQKRRLIPRFFGGSLQTSESISSIFESSLSGEKGKIFFVAERAQAINSCSDMTNSMRSMQLSSPKSDHHDFDSDLAVPNECSTHNKKDVALSMASEFDANKISKSDHGTEKNEFSLPPYPRASCRSAHATLDAVPIFTLPQVTALCERVVNECEERLRQEYDSVLSYKLAGKCCFIRYV